MARESATADPWSSASGGPGSGSGGGGGEPDGRGSNATDGNGNGAVSALGPPLTLPKGGGAIRGMGEKFATNVATGAGTFSVPLPLSPGRAGSVPTVALGYDSARGNGPFGLGWALDVPQVSRRTDKGLPHYDDRDTFVLAGAEDLVPSTEGPDSTTAPGWTITRYRPRQEEEHLRIERWVAEDGDSHWRVLTSDNVLHTYGSGLESRIADPEDPGRVFTWLLSHSRDDRGNVVAYTYRNDDGAGIDLACACERNRGGRDDPRRRVNRYLKRVRYANRTPLLDPVGRRPRFVSAADLDDSQWLLELVLDYGEHDQAAPGPEDIGEWATRPDPFSTRRAGFEVRTTRRCRRFLMFHHVPDTDHGPGYDGLVRSVELTYAAQDGATTSTGAGYSKLVAITQYGHRPDGPGYLRRGLPPLELEYSEPEIDPQVRAVGPGSDNLPAGLIGYEWADLHGEGAPGLLKREPHGWYYLRNQGPLSAPQATFTPAAVEGSLPQVSLQTRLLDLTGDGVLDLVDLDGPQPGCFPHGDGESWLSYRPFDGALPTTSEDPELRLVDLDGDATTDALVTAGDQLWWYRGRGREGFGRRRIVHLPTDEEAGPVATFGDRRGELQLADMSGDGLADLVRVRATEVSYWPNLGHGRFGAKVTMDHAPQLDETEEFDSRRVRLADLDGSGTSDLIYLHRDGVRVFFNKSGNAWGEPVALDFPAIDDTADVSVLDLLGTGTAALVWSSPLPQAQPALRYVQLLPHKPHLLVRSTNNLGEATTVRYAPSTRFAAEDRLAGRPWVTRLPFPVHVVERVDVHDLVGGNRFTTTYRYHHGCFDADEREFAGFGLVETLEADDRTDDDGALRPWRPPTLTRTWHHCGTAAVPALWPTGEGWRGDPQAELGRTAPSPAGLRALRGQVLRTEVYGVDDGPLAAVPYSVTQHDYAVRELQPVNSKTGHPGVYRLLPRQSVAASYERQPDDPRVRQDVTLEVDDFGNVLAALSVAYPRRAARSEPGVSPGEAAAVGAVQATPLVRATRSEYTVPLNDPGLHPDDHRTPMGSRQTVAAMTWPGLPTARLATWEEASSAWSAARANPVAADVVPARDLDPTIPPTTASWRVTEERVLLFRSDDLTTLLPPGRLEPRALPGETYRLTLTDDQLTEVLGALANPATLAEAGYVRLAGESGWWSPQGRLGYAPDAGATPAAERARAHAHFFLPRRVVDAFGGVTTTDFDPCDLRQVRSVDPVGGTVTARVDFRVLAPGRTTDANGAHSEAAFDALGQVVGVALLGTSAEPTGDSLAGFVADLPPATLTSLVEDLAGAGDALGRATSRTVHDRSAFWRSRDAAHPTPVCTLLLNRRQHTLADPAGTDLQVSVAHSDGLGREVQRKTEAEPGPVPDGGPVAARRWIGSSWVVLDRAGDAAQTFEPFFSRTHRYEPDRRSGLATTVVRDPLRRVVGQLHPDGTWDKTVLEAWRQEQWDGNDTVMVEDCRTDPVVGPALRRVLGEEPDAYTSWRRQRLDGSVGTTAAEVAASQDAAVKAAALAGTPAVSLLDPGGRLVAAVADAGPEGKHVSRTALDQHGRPLAVTDPLGRRVLEQVSRSGGLRSGLDLSGHTLFRASMDAGPHVTLPDVEGKPIRSRDARGVSLRWRYDALRRPTHLFATPPGGSEALLQRWIYGEGVAGANAAGRVYRIYDGTGLLEHSHYDAQGNLTDVTRRFTRTHRGLPDWSAGAAESDPATVATLAEPLLEAAAYRKRTWYDAIGRPVQSTTPTTAGMQPCVLRRSFGAGGLLSGVHVWLHRADTPGSLLDLATADLRVLTGVSYDEHGQVLRRERGNGTVTTYRYDPGTSRLLGLTTTRPDHPADRQIVQSLAYSHDPVGNVTMVRDDADLANVVFFRNRRVEPGSDYTYDHLSRLVRAAGREHVGLTGGARGGPTMPGPDDSPRTGLAHPGDGNAVTTYVETYTYDAVGNLQEQSHTTAEGRWRRGFSYAEPSALHPGQTSNRLSATGRASTPVATWTDRYTYDEGGCTTTLPHLAAMSWDLGGRLASTATQVVVAPGAVPETTHYDYDGDGERTRLTIDRTAAMGTEPTVRAQRLYLPGLEIDRELAADGSVTLIRETLRVDTGEETLALVQTRTFGTDAGPGTLVRHQYANHLGSATLELAQDADVVSYEEYFPYGGTAYAAVRSALEAPKRERWLGKQRDPSGLVDIGVRYYAPWLGRWLSPDPSETADGLNFYLYAKANPVTLRDSNGREVEAYYIAPGRPGNQPWMWFLGISAHRLIAYHYEGSHLNEKRGIYTNYIPISTILTDARIGDPSRLSVREQAAKPDITNVSSREVFEIKPWNSQGEADARREVRDYQTWLNRGMGVPAGGRGSSGPSQYPFLLGRGASGQLAVQFHGGRMVWRLAWQTTEDGVVLYKWQKISNTDRDDIRRAGESQWVDITEADAQAYGQEVFEEVDRGLGRRQTLFRWMDITNTVQEVVGVVVSSIIMGRIMGMRPGARPNVPAPAPGVRPVVPPSPVPGPGPVAPPPTPPTVPPWMVPPPGGTPPPTIRPGL